MGWGLGRAQEVLGQPGKEARRRAWQKASTTAQLSPQQVTTADTPCTPCHVWRRPRHVAPSDLLCSDACHRRSESAAEMDTP